MALLFTGPVPAMAAGQPEAPPGAGFTMLRNEPFGAVATGYAGGIPVELLTRTTRGPATAPRLSAEEQAARARAEQLLRQLRVLGASTPLSRVRIAVPMSGGRPALLSPRARLRTRAASAPLHFVFQGFLADQQLVLQSFVQRAYPFITALYGEPAPAQRGRVVTVISDSTAGDGIYDLPATGSITSGGTIHIAADLPVVNPPYDPNVYNLTRQMLIAFHGSLIFGFDAWELGFSDAAALIVNYQALGSPRDFDPSQLGVYLLPIYDFFNRPELGNAFFFATGTSANLGFYRAGMAQAAWLKVYVENPSFLRQFNAAYYAQAATQNAATNGVPLPGNTPALKRIAAGLAPTVEDLSFNDWYRRQYVLDTAITTGEKLWFGVLPEADLVSGDTRSVFFGVAQHYSTAADGHETPLGGSGVVTAADERGVDVTAKSAELKQDNKAVFNTFGEAELNSQHTASGQLAVVGFAATGVPDRGRIDLLLRVSSAQAVAHFPYHVAGTETAPSAFYGATLGTLAGSVTVQPVGGTTTLARGAFQTSGVAYPSAPRVETTFTLTPGDGGAAVVLRRNSAWANSAGKPQSLAVLLETAPGNTAFTLTLPRTATNRLRMFSLPCTPVSTDEASVLGVDPRTLLLARYRPNLSADTFSKDGITYGITADKHELYPNISQPMAPGRGYWINLAGNLTAAVRGGEPPRATPYAVPLLGGWNQIGVPYNLTFDLNAVRVQFLKATPVSFATAVQNGWVGPGVWRWRAEGGYVRVDTGDVIKRRLQPFDGYYVFSRQARGVTLLFDTRLTRASVGTRAATLWQLSLGVTTATAEDTDNAFGVVTTLNGQPDHMPAAKPPAGTRTLTLSFLSGGTAAADNSGAGAESGWAESFVAPFATTASWPLLVDGALPGENVRLGWGDPRGLAESLDLTLVDETSGQRAALIDAAGTRGYTFVAGTSARRFHIDGKVLPAAIRGWSAVTLAGSHSVMLSGRIGRAGSAQVTIETGAGDVVRTLADDQSAQAGTARWMWDGRDDAGQLMASGRYLGRIRCTDVRGTSTGRTIAFDLR